MESRSYVHSFDESVYVSRTWVVNKLAWVVDGKRDVKLFHLDCSSAAAASINQPMMYASSSSSQAAAAAPTRLSVVQRTRQPVRVFGFSAATLRGQGNERRGTTGCCCCTS
eukprot:GHVU01026270.1.p1 GENE.GHVU01026270.1~~GHVU01026270.1.p1  ORF type:complete len:111 (+),score=13.02 GHVU01026270.1:57-389(+)